MENWKCQDALSLGLGTLIIFLFTVKISCSPEMMAWHITDIFQILKQREDINVCKSRIFNNCPQFSFPGTGTHDSNSFSPEGSLSYFYFVLLVV